MQKKSIAIVLAGGQSPLLWPKSRQNAPKQFLHFIGKGTLLQDTVERILPIFSVEDIYVSTTNDFVELVREQVTELPIQNIIVEPFARHTLPSVSLCLTQLSPKLSPDTICVLFPSDHYITNIGEFLSSIETAMEFASTREAIVAIGVTPTRPETNYGYIQVDTLREGLDSFYDRGIRYSKTFAEKPDYELAKKFLATGEFLWNTGIFVFTVSTFWNSLYNCSPELYNYFNILKRLVGRPQFDQAVLDTFRLIQSESFDTGIMERAGNAFVLESTFSWSDVGTWDEIYRLSLKDTENNYLVGDVIAIDVQNCFIQTEEKLIAAIEVQDLIIVDTKQVLLICKRGSSERVVEIVNFFRRKNAHTFL